MSASRRPSRAATMAAGSALSGVDQGVRDRLQPRGRRPGRLGRGLRVRLGAAEAGRQHPAARLLERGQAGVGGDPVEPGAYRRPALERAVGTPGAQVGLLDQVLGVVHRAEHAVAVRQQLPPERLGVADELGAVRGGLDHTGRPRKAASRSAGPAPAGGSTMGPNRAWPSGPRRASGVAVLAQAEQLGGELGVQVGGVPDGAGQVPPVGELVRGGQVHQSGSGELAESAARASCPAPLRRRTRRARPGCSRRSGPRSRRRRGPRPRPLGAADGAAAQRAVPMKWLISARTSHNAHGVRAASWPGWTFVKMARVLWRAWFSQHSLTCGPLIRDLPLLRKTRRERKRNRSERP